MTQFTYLCNVYNEIVATVNIKKPEFQKISNEKYSILVL